MKPIRLIMQAFGSYGKRTEIDFTKPVQNLFLITGDTGAGKTTIFDAIVFALYGQASSGSNKKEGAELQSQYVSLDLEPFVELTFSEEKNGMPEEYTVRRSPRHMRLLKRGAGSKEEKEIVSLKLPDGSEIDGNKRTVDDRLKEIIGLEKEQFMQVAMIAQGEFMEMLRADSDTKKEVFRRIFNTDLYRRITEEVKYRRKEKEAALNDIRTICRNEAGHAVIPDFFEGAEHLNEIRRRIVKADELSITDLEALLQGMESLSDALKEELAHAEAEYREKQRINNRKIEELSRAKALQNSFLQQKKAEKELEECRIEEPEIRRLDKLEKKIRDAYAVKEEAGRMREAEETAKSMRSKMEEQKRLLPELRATYDVDFQAEKQAQQIQKTALESYSRVKTTVEQALSILKEIGSLQAQVKTANSQTKAAKDAAEQAETQIRMFEQTEQTWKEESDRLAHADILLEQWKKNHEELQILKKEHLALETMLKELSQQQETAEKAAAAYRECAEAGRKKTAEYETARNAFFDAQAGYLAKELLKENEPCPVCGSKEHPSPCVLSEEQQTITRAVVEELAKQAEDLKELQSEKATEAGAAANVLKEKTNYFNDRKQALFAHVCRSLPTDTVPGKSSGSDADLPELSLLGECIFHWEEQLKEEGPQRQADAEKLQEIRDKLQHAEEEKIRLKSSAEEAALKHTECENKRTALQARLHTLESQKPYPDEEVATSELRKVTEQKEAAEAVLKKAQTKASETKSAMDQSETLLRKYEDELPDAEQKAGESRIRYREALEEKHLSEEEWQEIAREFTPSDADEYRERCEAFRMKKTGAELVKQTAGQAIGDQKEPAMDELEEESRKAKEELAEAEARHSQIRAYKKQDEVVLSNLQTQTEERKETVREYDQLGRLYRRLSGNVSGGRMDIETFVQRYYLQRILYAANRRFREMSAGQYELRMVDDAQAGEGKNRGLDLMVYSAVTGKVRAVRTLSGGESFMAALSLALGMADQIRELSSAVNPDIMFIDEGFGSLDEHSRNQAVKVLQQMAGGSRLVGIISHVTEMKQEMEDQLIVTKDEDGSHVKWQLS